LEADIIKTDPCGDERPTISAASQFGLINAMRTGNGLVDVFLALVVPVLLTELVRHSNKLKEFVERIAGLSQNWHIRAITRESFLEDSTSEPKCYRYEEKIFFEAIRMHFREVWHKYSKKNQLKLSYKACLQ
jgi:hypothetical protein